jgi:hypothetical protein
MRRLIAIVVLVLISGSAGQTEGSNIEIELRLSSLSEGAVVALPFGNLPEGTSQGGLTGISGLSNPSLGGGPGYFTIPAGEFLLAEPATIRWEWFDAGGNPVLKVTYYICNPGGCPRPKARFRIKTKEVVLGDRG